MANTNIIVDLSFGDGGKGLVTSCLSDSSSLVVRFSAGCNAGHTVVKNGFRHVFSSLGAGTLNGADTYISEYCTMHPIALIKEWDHLADNGFHPNYYIHPLAMITTPFDVEYNKSRAYAKGGSVGVGFGATVARHEETPYKLFAVDLENKSLLEHKLRKIAQWYRAEDVDSRIVEFMYVIDQLNAKMMFNIASLAEIKDEYATINFEGSQGIMLDRDFGYFPDVTRASTTSKNAMAIIRENRLPTPMVYYVMRAYATRHGNGHMPYEDVSLNFADETNKECEYQGKFRQGHHCMSQIRYALKCDGIYSGNDFKRKVLYMGHMDQTEYLVYEGGRKRNLYGFADSMGYDWYRVFFNNTPETAPLWDRSTV